MRARGPWTLDSESILSRAALTSYSLPQFRSTNELSRSTTSVVVVVVSVTVNRVLRCTERKGKEKSEGIIEISFFFERDHGFQCGRACNTVIFSFPPTEVTRKIGTVESREQGTVILKVEQADEMLQTVPRVPVAGIKRRWGNRHAGSLQESSPEVSSSGVLSPPPNFQPSTPESAVVKSEELQLWDLDLHRGLQTNGDHYRATITATTTTTVLPTVTDPASPFTTPIEGLLHW